MYHFIIKEIREEKNITISELASKTGVSEEYIKKIEANELKDPKFFDICKIAEILEENLNNIYYIDDDVESLRNILNVYIKKYGLTHIKTIEITKLLDKLTVESIENFENSQKNKDNVS